MKNRRLTLCFLTIMGCFSVNNFIRTNNTVPTDKAITAAEPINEQSVKASPQKVNFLAHTDTPKTLIQETEKKEINHKITGVDHANSTINKAIKDVKDNLVNSIPTAPDSNELQELQSRELADLHSLQERFNTEDFNDDWGGELESRFYETINQITNQQFDISRVECRTSMCQFDIAQTDIETQNKFLKFILEKYKNKAELYKGSLFRYQDENEQFRTTYFLFKDNKNSQ